MYNLSRNMDYIRQYGGQIKEIYEMVPNKSWLTLATIILLIIFVSYIINEIKHEMIHFYPQDYKYIYVVRFDNLITQQIFYQDNLNTYYTFTDHDGIAHVKLNNIPKVLTITDVTGLKYNIPLSSSI